MVGRGVAPTRGFSLITSDLVLVEALRGNLLINAVGNVTFAEKHFACHFSCPYATKIIKDTKRGRMRTNIHA